MEQTQRTAEIISTELDRFDHERDAEALRWAVWFAWEEFPDMTSRQFADAAETLGVNRGTATNRFSEARRNWETMNA